jgi:hypothetical protein
MLAPFSSMQLESQTCRLVNPQSIRSKTEPL